MSFCESKCEYGGYDNDIKKVKCKCEVKIPLMSEIKFNSNILKKKIDIKNALNLNVMKCFKTAFSTKGIKGNIGIYIILLFILTVSICLVLFLIKGFSIIKGYINAINSNNIIKEKYEQQSERNDGRNAKIIKKVKQNKIINISISLLNKNVIINNNNEGKANDEKNISKENKVDFPPKNVRKINKLI